MFAFVNAYCDLSNLPRRYFDTFHCLTLKVQNQRNPKRKRSLGLQIVADDINRQVILAEPVFNLALGFVVDSHAISRR